MRPAVCALALLALVLAPAVVAAAPPAATFTHGVASGDVTHVSALLWTRVDREADLLIEVATDAAIHDVKFRRTVHVTGDSDFTAKVLAVGLAPGRRYFFRWRAPTSTSETGTFWTAPAPGRRADLRFTYTADTDGTVNPVSGAPAFNSFEVLAAAEAEHGDFFVYLGDTIYSDSAFRLLTRPPATTLDEYREAYKINRDFPALQSLLRSTSIVAMWDDHEVRNDYAGQTVDRDLYATGRLAFLEYMPAADSRVHDAECAGNPRFRTFRWGRDVEFIQLDERSCRSEEVVAACSVNGQFDFGPALPAPFRQPPFFAPAPPPGCLEALTDPTRTMLGKVQKALFKAALLGSAAKFKFVLNEVAIAQQYVTPYDRWEGYAAERREVLEFIRDHHITGVIFLTTDEHENHVAPVLIDRVTDPVPVAWEFVTGPVAYFTGEQLVRGFFGGGLLADAAIAAEQQVLTFAGNVCRNLNKNSYGLVEVDTTAGTVTVTLKDGGGQVVRDQLHPSIECTLMLVPE